MKSFHYLFVLILSFIAAPNYAQIGIRLGLNLTDLQVDVDNSPFTVETNSKIGFHVGLSYEGKVSEQVSLQPELLLFQKGYRIETSGDDINRTINYLELPVLVKYNFNGTSQNVFLLAGPAVGFGISARARVGDNSESVEWEATDLKRFDFGLHLGGGIAIPTGNGAVLIDLRYLLGIANIADSNPATNRNRGFSLNLGFEF